MKPSGEGRFTSKTADFSKELYEDFLRKVLSFRNTSGHSQAQRIDATIVALIKILESPHVSLACLLRQFVVFLLCVGFSCRHVIRLLLASWKKSNNFRQVVQHADHVSAVSRGHTVRSRKSAWGCGRRSQCPQRGCDAVLRARRCLIQQ